MKNVLVNDHIRKNDPYKAIHRTDMLHRKVVYSPESPMQQTMQHTFLCFSYSIVAVRLTVAVAVAVAVALGKMESCIGDFLYFSKGRLQ